MTQYKSYPGGQAQKDELIAALKADRAADRFRQGAYGGFDDDGEFRGCALGCTIRALHGDDADFGDHDLMARTLGIPVELCHLEDRIFENLGERHRDWPVEFAEAVPVRRDLRPALSRWFVWLLTDPSEGVAQFADAQGRAELEAISALHRRVGAGGEVTPEEWAAAGAAAGAAAEEAEGAARAAAWAAREAAWAAGAAREAAWAAAGAAREAAWAAAWAAREAAWAAWDAGAAREAAWADAREKMADAREKMADRLLLEMRSA